MTWSGTPTWPGGTSSAGTPGRPQAPKNSGTSPRRGSAARYPRDESLAALLAQLRAGSDRFARLWGANPVRVPGHRRKTITHPSVGPVHVNCDVLDLPEDDQQLVFITADTGTPDERALRHLRTAAQDRYGR